MAVQAAGAAWELADRRPGLARGARRQAAVRAVPEVRAAAPLDRLRLVEAEPEVSEDRRVAPGVPAVGRAVVVGVLALMVMAVRELEGPLQSRAHRQAARAPYRAAEGQAAPAHGSFSGSSSRPLPVGCGANAFASEDGVARAPSVHRQSFQHRVSARTRRVVHEFTRWSEEGYNAAARRS